MGVSPFSDVIFEVVKDCGGVVFAHGHFKPLTY